LSLRVRANEVKEEPERRRKSKISNGLFLWICGQKQKEVSL
jgi:hypothetical protein